MRATIVVPCYNEAARLDPDAFVAFADAHPDVTFLLVDDGSTDTTRQVHAATAARAPGRITTLALDANGGKAEAVRRGVLRALDDGAPAVGFWDADLATPLALIPEFVRVLDERPDVEIVLGSRVRLLGRRIERDPRRHYFGRVAATAVSRMLGLAVYDTQCGAKLFRTTPRLRELFAEPFATRWVFDVEILARWMIATGHRGEAAEQAIVELPLPEWRDVRGSKLKWTDFVRAPLELWRIRERYGAALGGVPGR